MKKILFFICLISCFGLAFPQNSAGVANYNTAMRYLKLAENNLTSGNWSGALLNAEQGLSYDSSISDLEYVKAASKINLGDTKFSVLSIMNRAFDMNNWHGYSKNGARILYADLLSDTGHSEESNKVLDSEPYIYSADAEFIRIKNYYRIGTEEAKDIARVRINGARRFYPSDMRFPNIFFMFEHLFMFNARNAGEVYVVPEIVQTIADSYIAKLPDYSGSKTLMELYASFFAGDEERIRLVKAIDAKNMTNHPLLAIAALETGLFDENKAFDFFFDSSSNSVNYSLLEYFCRLVLSDEVQQKIVEKLANFEGTVYIDENNDLQNEISIRYELGRPVYISYDGNNDGVYELTSRCDYGAPVSVSYNDNASELYYDSYPNVQKVVFNKFNLTFSFLYNDYTFKPYDLVPMDVLEPRGLNFYVVKILSNLVEPVPDDLIEKSSGISTPVTERENARVSYTTSSGKLINARFYEGDFNYAYCDFSTGLPFVRYVDYNNDGIFETAETFDSDERFSDEAEKNMIASIFSEVAGKENIYLKKVQIDANGNSNYEYCEEFLPAGGKISYWDDDDNGVWNLVYTRMPKINNEPVSEETVFYNDNGLPRIKLYSLGGIPVKMNYENSDVLIFAGKNQDVYWIDEQGSEELENLVMNELKIKPEQGVVKLISVNNDETRVSVIRIEKQYFLRIIPKEAD